jgi:hypothetical protein
MSLTKLIVLGIGLIVIVGGLLWFLGVPSYFQNSLSSSYNAPYTSLTLRDGINGSATLDFGDTEYNFDYTGGILTDSTFIGGSQTHWTPQTGDVYKDFGIETRVSKVASDYISNYIVILVKPTIQNYMASLHYTKVEITSSQSTDVDISSGLINKTNHYSFTYLPSPIDPKLQIDFSGQSKQYGIVAGWSGFSITDFDIEVKVFKAEPKYVIIYVKPLY